MWNTFNSPTNSGWQLIKVDETSESVPARWSSPNMFWSDMTGKTYKSNEIYAWFTPEITKQTIIDSMLELSNDDRLDIISDFCTTCGSEDPGCECWNNV